MWKRRIYITISRKNKDINYVGIDLKDEVIVYAIRKVKEKEEEVKREFKNIRFVTMNIMGIAEVFDKNEISKIYINFATLGQKKSIIKED